MSSAFQSLFVYLFGALVVFSSGTDLPAGELKYAPETGETYAYLVEVTVELPTATETMKGAVIYTVKELAEGEIKLEARGGLQKSQKTKPGIRFRPGGPSRLSSLAYRGLRHTTTQVDLSPQGKVRRLSGDSQLPYLLGHLSLLVFEPLPEAEQETWETSNSISISKVSSTSFRRLPPGRIPGRTDNNQSVQAEEKTTYKLVKDKSGLASVEKTFHLKTPKLEESTYVFEGSGTWMFDEASGMPHSLTYSQEYKVEKPNLTVKVPIKIQFKRLTGEELATHLAEVKQREAELQERIRQAQEAAAAKRKIPLTAEQKAEVLTQLASDKLSDILRGMNTLRFKDPQEPDPEIAAALKQLGEHKNFSIRLQAEQIGKKWAAPQEEKP